LADAKSAIRFHIETFGQKEQIMREYEVTEEDIWAALHYATELIEAEEFHPLPVPAG